MGQFQVNTAELKALGARVVQQGETVKRTVADAAPQLTPAGATGSPWATVAQAAGTASGWSEYLTGLAARIGTAGQSLVDTAELYRAADQRSAGRLPQ